VFLHRRSVFVRPIHCIQLSYLLLVVRKSQRRVSVSVSTATDYAIAWYCRKPHSRVRTRNGGKSKVGVGSAILHQCAIPLPVGSAGCKRDGVRWQIMEAIVNRSSRTTAEAT
jgi:hypothetical protein